MNRQREHNEILPVSHGRQVYISGAIRARTGKLTLIFQNVPLEYSFYLNDFNIFKVHLRLRKKERKKEEINLSYRRSVCLFNFSYFVISFIGQNCFNCTALLCKL